MESTEGPETVRFTVGGMICVSCVNHITRALQKLDGVDRVRVDLAGETVTLRRMRIVASDTLAAAVTAAGYTADMSSMMILPAESSASRLSRLLRRTT